MKVKRITRVGKSDVYNMEVDDTHSFVIQGGIISHNCADEVRYFCMSRPIKPRAKEQPDEYASNGYKLFLDVDKKDLSKAQAMPRSVIHE